jgi:PAS domain S-box-containing protein
MWDLFPKEIADRQARTVRNVIHSGNGTMVESPTVVAGGQRWYRTSIEPVRDAAGNVASALILARDITVQKQAAQALRRSEALYRTTIDALADAVHVVDRDLRITLFNARFADWCQELGLATSAAGRTVFEQFPFLPERVDQEYRQIFETGESLTTEDEVTVGGREILTEVRKSPILEDGQVARVVTVVRDVTQLRQAERALRKSEERFRAQYKSIPLPTYTWKKTGNDFVFTDCNDAATESTEGKTSGYIGVKLADMYADEPRRVRDIHRCFETHKVIREESLYRFRTTGQERYLASTYAFVPPDLVMVHTEDITERKGAERALQPGFPGWRCAQDRPGPFR